MHEIRPPDPGTTHAIVMECTRLKDPIIWSRERSDVVFDKEILIFNRVNPPKSCIHSADPTLESVEVLRMQCIGVLKDLNESFYQTALEHF